MTNKIIIRAGLLYDLYCEKIKKETIMEIIDFSKFGKQIKEFEKLENCQDILLNTPKEQLTIPCDNMLDKFKTIPTYAENYLLNKIESDNNYNQLVEFNIESFKRYIDKIATEEYEAGKETNENIKRIKSVHKLDNLDSQDDYNMKPTLVHNCTYEDFINYIIDYSNRINQVNNAILIYEQKMQCGIIPKSLNLSPPVFNFKTRGHKKEFKIIQLLQKLGFKVQKSEKLYFNLTSKITLAGRPDGYIEYSPIPGYSDIYLEIKNKSYEKIIKREELQLYAYWKLTDKPILLITTWKKKTEFRLYSREELERGWKNIKRRLIQNVNRLEKLINVDNMEKYYRFKKIVSNDIIIF